MSVVMLSGPVGAGKTTVARELIAISLAPLNTYRDFYAMFEDLSNHQVGAVEANPAAIARRIRDGLDRDLFRLPG